MSYAPDVAHTSVDPSGRHVVVDLSAPATPPRVLAGPAAIIWGCVDGVRDLDGLVEAVAAEAELEPDDVRADVTAFVADLLHLGLLREGTA